VVVTEEQVPDLSPDYKKLYVVSTGKGPGDTGPGGKGDIRITISSLRSSMILSENRFPLFRIMLYSVMSSDRCRQLPSLRAKRSNPGRMRGPGLPRRSDLAMTTKPGALRRLAVPPLSYSRGVAGMPHYRRRVAVSPVWRTRISLAVGM
jgi:hypothetical protein